MNNLTVMELEVLRKIVQTHAQRLRLLDGRTNLTMNEEAIKSVLEKIKTELAKKVSEIEI